MKTLPITSLIIPPDRQRTDIPDEYIGELLGSIFDTGLINAVVVRDGNTLVAGECRTKAITLGYKLGKTLYYAGQPVPAGHVPIIDHGELTPIQRMEIEYAENAYRKDLTWQENAKALAALHELRTVQKAAVGEVQRPSDTAREVFKRADGWYSGTVTDSVLLTKHMSDPEVAKAKTVKDAKKILARKDEQQRREVLAQLVGAQAVTERFKVYNSDCLTWMMDSPAEQFDVILTDPPYGMGADQFGDAAGKIIGIEHQYDDSSESMRPLMAKCIPEFYRLAKPQAHLYLWCDIDHFHWLREQCEAAGWRVHRTPLVNIKPQGGRVPWPEHGPRRSYELCLYAVKGDKKVTSIRPDTFESRMPEGNLGHGAQKPVEAYVELLKRSVAPGDVVFDAFAGTGTIFAAAAEVKCSAVGVELAQHAYGICLERIEELK